MKPILSGRVIVMGGANHERGRFAVAGVGLSTSALEFGTVKEAIEPSNSPLCRSLALANYVWIPFDRGTVDGR